MNLEKLVRAHFYSFAGRMYQSPEDNTIWGALEKERATGAVNEREYPSIDILAKDAIVSQPYADIIHMREPQQLRLVADVEVKYNEE